MPFDNSDSLQLFSFFFKCFQVQFFVFSSLLVRQVMKGSVFACLLQNVLV